MYGVAEQVLAELRGIGGVQERYRVPPSGATLSTVIALLDPESVKLALDRVCQSAGVDILFGTLLVGAVRDGDRIEAAILQDDRGPREVPATTFVGASGEGDLAAFGGASVRYGTHNLAQLGTLSVRFGGVSLEADLTPEWWADAIRAAEKAGVPMLDKERVSRSGCPSRETS